MKLKDILALPERERDVETIYDSILIANSKKKHDSGRAIMYIVWLDKDQEPIEVIKWHCDDIWWVVPPHDTDKLNFTIPKLRTDRQYNGCIRFHSSLFRFKVGTSLSSTEITLIPNN